MASTSSKIVGAIQKPDDHSPSSCPPPSHQPGALGPAALDVAEDPVELAARDHRPELGRVVERRAHLECLGPLDQAVEEPVVERAFDEQPRARGARLAGVQEDPDRDGVHRLLEVRVREDDDRRLAAGLERDALERPCPELHQPAADLAAAGEADLVDPRVGGQRLADDLAGTDDAVRHAMRQALGYGRAARRSPSTTRARRWRA